MSYPNLGCFSECLTCELCENGFPPPDSEPKLFPDYEDYDRLFGDDDLWGPSFEPGDDSFEWPSLGIDLGDYHISPSFDPWGLKVSGKF